MTFTNKYLKCVLPTLPEILLSRAAFLITTQKPSGNLNQSNIFSQRVLSPKNYTKHNNKNTYTFTTAIIIWELLPSALFQKPHSFLSVISITISKTGSNKRFMHQSLWKKKKRKNLICADLLVSESAVTVFNCQSYRVLTVVLQRRKHMQAQLVKACLLNSTLSYTDFLV